MGDGACRQPAYRSGNMTISSAAGVDVGRDWLDVAIARKLVVAANAILKHREPWKPAQRS
jgi:hypothetical protein